MSGRPRWLRWLAIIAGSLLGLILLAFIALVATVWIASSPLPEGTPGPEADALAESLRESVDYQAWDRTGAVAWSMGGMRDHLWDRQRHLDRFHQGDLTVWVNLNTHQGRAERAGEPLTGDALTSALEEAWAAWANDSFWLNPVVKVFDDGTERRKVVLDDGREALLITYTSGGVTPGDSYLWIPGPDGRPTHWQLWVQIIPVGGLQTTWEGWTELPTGAWIATTHAGPLGLTISMQDVRAAATLAELEGDDPFAQIAD